MVNTIRSSNALWEATEVSENKFANYTDEEVTNLMGTVVLLPGNPLLEGIANHEITGTVPISFDSRNAWPGCVHQIRDQQQCGSCWAFGASEALSDRFCIASNKQIHAVLSPENMVSCDTSDHGCKGGNIGHAWQYLESNGIPSDKC